MYATSLRGLIDEMLMRKPKRYINAGGWIRDIFPLPPPRQAVVSQLCKEMGCYSARDVDVVAHLCFSCVSALNGMANAAMPNGDDTK